MKTILIPEGKRFLVMGVNWHPYPKSNPKKYLRQKSADRAYDLYCDLGNGHKAGDFFGLLPAQELKKSSLYSVAHLLMKITDQRESVGIIIKHDQYYGVICINKGQPIRDEVFVNEKQAVTEIKELSKALGFKPNVNFENSYGFSYTPNLPELLLAEGKNNKAKPFKEVPQNTFSTIAFGLIAVVCLCTYWQYNEEQKRIAEELRLQAIKDADPVPKYISNLLAKTGSFAMPDNTALRIMNNISELPTSPKGWRLTSVACKSIDNTCFVKYSRTDGIYSNLNLDIARYKLTVSEPADLNTALFTFNINPDQFEFSDYNNNFDHFVKEDFGDTGQNWLTAGLGVSMTNPTLWPETPGVSPMFVHPLAIKTGKLTITNLPLYLFSDFLKSKPINVNIQDFQLYISYSNNSKLPDEATLTVNAAYYVK